MWSAYSIHQKGAAVKQPLSYSISYSGSESLNTYDCLVDVIV
jgi:hypothetical protein